MRDLHTRLAEVNRKYVLGRGDDIHETGARLTTIVTSTEKTPNSKLL
ncbi:hypothetical protein [Duncaniella freteri]|nr:hypothetical protein [Duncaniella freteri]